MKTAIHIALILLIGVGMGLAIRSMRPAGGPRPDDVVFTNDGRPAEDASEIENPTPTKPPEDEEWLSRFELTERSGKPIKSEDLKGQPYVVSFFFARCPSICVQQNQIIKELQDEFEGQGVRFVAISVDPENDSPEVLREYAARFGADDDQWLFMTGDLTYIRRIGGEVFRQPVDKQFHTERFVLVDPNGEIEGFYNWPEKRQLSAMKDKIREMMNAKDS